MIDFNDKSAVVLLRKGCSIERTSWILEGCDDPPITPSQETVDRVRQLKERYAAGVPEDRSRVFKWTDAEEALTLELEPC